MLNNFQDKVALITGGTSGLGRAISLEFAKSKANVVVSGRREKEGNETVQMVESLGSKAIFVKCDVTRSEEVKNLLDATIQNFGKLDFAVNNAGIIGKNKLIYQYEETEFDEVMNINVKGVWNAMKYETLEFLKSKKGSIVNISSVSGLIGFPYNSLYSASKHAINGLTKSAALEFGHKGIRINAVCPGGIKTEMLENIFEGTGKPSESKENMIKLHSLRRLAEPEEIARAVVWLCGDDSSFIHGAVIPIDGGWTAH
jgi:NAD(P)-dependent dehydrogenase (short-subunit alcohol dehydrogenase family)